MRMKNEYGLSPEAFNVVKFLRTTKEIKLIEAVMADRRVEAFKGLSYVIFNLLSHSPIYDNRQSGHQRPSFVVLSET